ncbi:hypothetical protein G6L37_04240 [Agrobacterium rubi]|nr:hypothetical protein [Agrobacterium rubi]NTF24561.1 hypothetical protein [Agrobacterium rubi]
MAVKKIEDAGIKIGGARKDWRDINMSVADLAALTGEERASLVKKDNIWPKPDYAALVEAGMTAEAAACMKVLRDSLAASPSKSGARSVEEAQEGYVKMISALRDAFMETKTTADVKQVYSKLVTDFGGNEAIKRHPVSAIWFSVYNKRSCPFAMDHKTLQKAREMLSNGFPEDVPAWRKNVSFYGGGNGGLMKCYKGNQLVGAFATRDEAFDELKRLHEAAEAAKKASKADIGPKKPPLRPHLDTIEREGMTDHRRGRDIDSQEFIDTFGFLGVEFGNWVPDHERQTMINLGYDGMMDLAEILGWEPIDMSLGRRLSAAFGARGMGGKGAAHYEAGRAVYNFTRFNGAGSQAHEFAHALDHFIGQGTSVLGPDRVPSITGWRHRLNKNAIQILAHHGEEVGTAWNSLIDAFEKTAITQEEAAETARDAIHRYERSIEETTARAAEYLEKVGNDALFQEALTNVTERKQMQEKRLETLLSMSPNENFGYRRSSYFTEALKLSGPSGYEARPNEMFARAFECFIFDEIEARGAVSQYLVAGVEEDRYADTDMWKGNPYPTNTERENFRALFTHALEASRPLIENARDAEATYGA